MPECRPSNVRSPGNAARRNTFHDRSLPGFLLIALLYCGDSVADEHASNPAAAPGSTVAGSRQSPPVAAVPVAEPEFFTLSKDAGAPPFSPTDFRPRKRSVFERDPVLRNVGRRIPPREHDGLAANVGIPIRRIECDCLRCGRHAAAQFLCRRENMVIRHCNGTAGS